MKLEKHDTINTHRSIDQKTERQTGGDWWGIYEQHVSIHGMRVLYTISALLCTFYSLAWNYFKIKVQNTHPQILAVSALTGSIQIPTTKRCNKIGVKHMFPIWLPLLLALCDMKFYGPIA